MEVKQLRQLCSCTQWLKMPPSILSSGDRRITDTPCIIWAAEKSLDVSGGSSAAGANIWQYVYNGSGAQRWVIDNAGDGSVVIRDALGTILDVSGGKASGGQNIWAYTANRSDAQRFYPQEIVTHAEDEAVDGGVYTISPACAPGKCLDVSGAEVTNGTNIRRYAANSTDAQKFLLTKTEISGRLPVIRRQGD